MIDTTKTYLYHYTIFESAVKILASQKLLFTKVEKLNDINESMGPICLGVGNDEQHRFEELCSAYRQLSFSMDKGSQRGFDIPVMWGHYAARGHGVCLVFDKEKIDAEVAKESSRYSKEVVYTPTDPYSILYNKGTYGSVDIFISASKDEIFFHKTKDWEYEQEYRVIMIDDRDENQYLNIDTSLVAIILYARKHDVFLNSIEYCSLSKIHPTLSFYRYIPSSTSGGSWNLYDVKGESIRPKLKLDFDLGKVFKAKNEPEEID